MRRLFAAIKITPDENFLKIYYNLIKKLSNDSIKWVEPQNFHLTLKFFGEIPEDKVNIICRELDFITPSFSPFNLHIQKTGVFGSRYNPKVIWFGIRDSSYLTVLAEKILTKMDEAGFARDRQNFIPHLTVGRIRRLSDKQHFQKTIKRFEKADLMEIGINEIYLYESHLKPEGPVYETVEKFIL
ncbi:MAG: RNA 2',3'-cyclic phosphodiesterase [Chlorobi bacterium]|nr:RNA 2',3'-cyclic phosphodiesterase [Chlorobiota bacterium]